MKRFFKYLSVLFMALMLSGCMAEKSYLGNVNVVGVGAGAKPAKTDVNYVDAGKYNHSIVVYTPNIAITEQKTNDTVKYVAGDALVKSFSGEPSMMVAYLNAYQAFKNKALIIDKNGVVAWSGAFRGNDIENANGTYDYGITGEKRMTFKEAMEKFVLNEEVTDFDKDKVIEFPQGNGEKFLSGFSYAKRHPLLFTKLPDMKFIGEKGEITLSQILSNKKPTVLIFYMAQGERARNLGDDLSQASYLLGVSEAPVVTTPAAVLQQIESIYLSK
ncbi:MAG: hypothetical protein IE916_04305 [Epsilonproteobacteria bacterium]|nr:hypothetical protein [Campylobacterota bacterium]